MVRPLTHLAVVLVVMGGCVSSAFAQQSGLYPRSGPISPWMNIFQKNPGPLDNYHTFVKPDIQLQQTLTQQNAALQRQQVQLQTLGRNVTKGQKEPPIPPTGTGSVFMSYSHFYNRSGARGVAAAPASRTVSATTTLPNVSRGISTSQGAAQAAR